MSGGDSFVFRSVRKTVSRKRIRLGENTCLRGTGVGGRGGEVDYIEGLCRVPRKSFVPRSLERRKYVNGSTVRRKTTE